MWPWNWYIDPVKRRFWGNENLQVVAKSHSFFLEVTSQPDTNQVIHMNSYDYTWVFEDGPEAPNDNKWGWLWEERASNHLYIYIYICKTNQTFAQSYLDHSWGCQIHIQPVVTSTLGRWPHFPLEKMRESRLFKCNSWGFRTRISLQRPFQDRNSSISRSFSAIFPCFFRVSPTSSFWIGTMWGPLVMSWFITSHNL